MRRLLAAAALAILLLLLGGGEALAGAGGLDTSFSFDGKVVTSLVADDDRASGVAVQPDGKIVAAGVAFNGSDNDFALARYNPDGSLDAGFGADGKVVTPIGSSD